jgi:hypothetical protein
VVLGGLVQNFPTSNPTEHQNIHLASSNQPYRTRFVTQTIDHLRQSPLLLVMARFIYSPLKSAQKEIGLISLLSGLFDSDIKVKIFHEKLSEQYQPDYEALSYVWGSTEDPETISIANRNQHGDRTSPGSVGGSGAASVSEPFSRNNDHPIYETLSITQTCRLL